MTRTLIRPASLATPGSSPGCRLFSQREKRAATLIRRFAPPSHRGRRVNSRAGGADERRVGFVKRGEQALQVGDLRQVVVDDVRIGRVLGQKILVIVLDAIEGIAR